MVLKSPYTIGNDVWWFPPKGYQCVCSFLFLFVTMESIQYQTKWIHSVCYTISSAFTAAILYIFHNFSQFVYSRYSRTILKFKWINQQQQQQPFHMNWCVWCRWNEIFVFPHSYIWVSSDSTGTGTAAATRREFICSWLLLFVMKPSVKNSQCAVRNTLQHYIWYVLRMRLNAGKIGEGCWKFIQRAQRIYICICKRYKWR